MIHCCCLCKNFLFKYYYDNCFVAVVNTSFQWMKSKMVDFWNHQQRQHPARRRRINAYTKRLVAFEQNWRCSNCQNLLDAMYEIDHIIPVHAHGSDQRNNLQALCRNCHGAKTLRDQVVYLEKNKQEEEDADSYEQMNDLDIIDYMILSQEDEQDEQDCVTPLLAQQPSSSSSSIFTFKDPCAVSPFFTSSSSSSSNMNDDDIIALF